MPEIPYLFPAPRGSAGKAAEFSDVLDAGKPEDVAAAIAFLALPEAAFIRGTTLRADGGRINRL